MRSATQYLDAQFKLKHFLDIENFMHFSTEIREFKSRDFSSRQIRDFEFFKKLCDVMHISSLIKVGLTNKMT